MLAALRSALTRPASFFEREAGEPGLRDPALIVAATALVGLVSSIPVLRAVVGAVPAGADTFVLIGLAVGVVVGLVSPFAVWLLYALLFYGLSIVFDGEGEFRDLFALVGWGFAPNVLSGIVGGIVMLALVSGTDLSTPAEIQQFSRAATTDPLALFNRGFDLLMTLWSAWLWTHALAAGRDLSRRNAAICVAAVVIANVGLGLASTVLV